MAKIIDLHIENEDELCIVAKALSSPIRAKILKLLYNENLIIGDIAKKLNIPASSAALNVKILEEANLIRMEKQPGTRGAVKLCSRKADYVNINLLARDSNINETVSIEMPVGAYSICHVIPTCGLANADGMIGMEDNEYTFYLPERIHARILWTSGGFVEYYFPNIIPKGRRPQKLMLCMEICSEAPNFKENWKSDITVWINEIDCGTWTSPGDFGARRGRLNPPTWKSGNSQYGILVKWEIREDGCFINEEKVGSHTIDEIRIMDKSFIIVRIGNKEDAKYIGGFNIFGKGFGDYDQDIVMSIEYS